MKIERRTATGAPQGFSDFAYDYASRKAISREWNYQNGTFVKTDEKRRVFDGLDVVQERNSANEVTAQLVRDGNIGGILSRTTADGAAFYGYDGNGNVTLLTNSAGQDVGHYRYDAFGQTLEAVGPRASENPYRFSTKEVHAASELYDFGYRFYSPSMGRWINRDPLEENGGINLYGFVSNSLINKSDEYGLVFDVVLDTGFVIYDVYEIIRDPRSSTNWLALLADGGAAVIPFATGAGVAVRVGSGAAKAKKGAKVFGQVAAKADEFVAVGQKFVDNVTKLKLNGLSLQQGREKLLKQGLVEVVNPNTGRHTFRQKKGKTMVDRVAWDPGSAKNPSNHWHKFVPDNRVNRNMFKLNDKGVVVRNTANKAHIPSRGKRGKQR